MNLCPNCSKLLMIREEIKLNTRAIFWYCTQCNYKKKAINMQIEKKIYRLKTPNVKKSSFQQKKEINRHKSKDITLPIRKSTCTHCKQTNLNKYENKYHKSNFYVENICSNCYLIF